MWPALWKTNIPSITHEFMYKVLGKKLQVRGTSERYPRWVWSIGDCVPLCQELPDGADAICGVPRCGNAGCAGDGCGTVGGGQPHHCAHQPHGALCLVGAA